MSVLRQPAEQQNLESVRSVLRDLIEQYGAPSAADVEWAERALTQHLAASRSSSRK